MPACACAKPLELEITEIAYGGAGLARAVADAGYEVAKAPRINARSRRGTGKSDPLDVRAIAARQSPTSCAGLGATTESVLLSVS